MLFLTKKSLILIMFLSFIFSFTVFNCDTPVVDDNDLDSGIQWQRCTSDGVYNIGTAKYDITGPFIQESTGYNEPGTQMEGLIMRLYSRAYVIESTCSENRIVFVAAEMIHMFQSIKMGVIKKLDEAGLGYLYNSTNVIITATHTHGAPSNYSWYTLYNAFNGVMGFDELHYNIVVNGITESIIRAHNNMKPGRIKIAKGTLDGAAHNRSSLAYNKNIDAGDFAKNVDDEMVLLKLEGFDGSEIGMINWFAVHGTSLGIDNHRVHGDNKGWAAYRFEKDKSAGFVGAFAQGAMGDVSPNEPDPTDVTLPFRRPNDLDPSLDEIDNPVVHGTLQYNKASELYNSASTELKGGVFFRHSHVNFNNVAVSSAYIGDYVMPWDEDIQSASTCTGAIGAGFLAGDEEGAPVDMAAEGDIKNEFVYSNGQWVRQDYELSNLDMGGIESLLGVLWPLAESVLGSDKYADCQKDKFVLLPVGEVDDFWFPNPEVPFVPVIVPIQIVTLGQLAIVATSFEVSTMLGRRIKATLKNTLGQMGITDIVIAGIANSYGQYATTREEYAAQHFEGAFTLYGPWEGAAIRQEYNRVAGDLVNNQKSAAGPTPPDLSDEQFIETWISESGVVNDDGDFGAVIQNVNPSYSNGDWVTVKFVGAHPRTILQKKYEGTLGQYYNPETFTFIEIQKKSGSAWTTVLTDNDPNTMFTWTRVGGSLSPDSEVTIEWRLKNVAPGTYRIVYNGLAKNLLTADEPFKGYSGEFTVQ